MLTCAIAFSFDLVNQSVTSQGAEIHRYWFAFSGAEGLNQEGLLGRAIYNLYIIRIRITPHLWNKMSQPGSHYKFRLYIFLALFVAYAALLIYGPTAVEILGPPAYLLAIIALLFWRTPRVSSLQISDLRLYIALALFVACVPLLVYGPTAVQRLGPAAYALATIALLFWPKFFRSRQHRS